MPASQEGLERLVAGLEQAGYRVLRRRGVLPCELELSSERAGDVRLSARVLLLRPGGHHPVEGSMRVWVTQAARRPPAEGSRRLTLGYDPELGVFAGWPWYDLPRVAPRKQLWISRRALSGAGQIELRSGETSYAFRASQLPQYLDFHRVWPGVGVPKRITVRELFLKRSFRKAGGGEIDLLKELGSGEEPPASAAPEPREVETGFSSRRGEPSSPQRPLEPAADYLYWFAIGAETGASIDAKAVPLPEGLPNGARLTVQVFPFADELELTGPTRGELELLADGGARVHEPAAGVDNDLRQQLLYFPIRTPQRPGTYRLRSNLYYGSTLLQSRLSQAQVGGSADPERPSLRSTVDYSLASVLDLDTLTRTPTHDLSLMVNGDSGTSNRHDFRFFSAGKKPVVANASVGESQIAKAITESRGALRKASWNSEEEWVKGAAYLYEESPAEESRFAADLITMAIRGYRLYVEIAGKLSRSLGSRGELEETTRRPIRIQIASKEEGLYLPAGLFYDHPLEDMPSEENRGRFRLCDQFLADLKGEQSLELSVCLGGDCPNYEDDYVVCPSGFWGYRHEIGWPLGIENDGDDEKPLTEIGFDGRAEMVIGVSTAPDLERRQQHLEAIGPLANSGKVAETRDDFGTIAKSRSPHVVYFYCHGGVSRSGGYPYLELGPLKSEGLSRGYLFREKIRWGERSAPRPLVFINGCHTAALQPDTMGNLVGGFVFDANAVGVVGTEVTVFEPLACDFAESVLGNFLSGAMSIGAAIRRARLDLLTARNPLGLVYVPFVAAETKLVRS